MSTLQATIELQDTSTNVPSKVGLPAEQQLNHSTGPEPSDEPPSDATEAIPDGGYGWTVVAACAFILFWINGYTTAWGVLQTAVVK